MAKKVNKYISYFLDNNASNAKIIYKDKIIYPNFSDIDTELLASIKETAEYSRGYFDVYSESMFFTEIRGLMQIESILLDMFYDVMYQKLKYYAFYLPNDYILYIEKTEENSDFWGYLKTKALFINVKRLIKRKRNIIILMFRQQIFYIFNSICSTRMLCIYSF